MANSSIYGLVLVLRVVRGREAGAVVVVVVVDRRWNFLVGTTTVRTGKSTRVAVVADPDAPSF